jgi:hypothetical protein
MSPLTESTRLTLAKQSVASGLLDAYGGAAAAYSLRRLSANYTGPVVRVRRSSDNTEQDFTATQVTDGTLTTFCGAGNGFVRTWYDQSGNARNAEQATTANQPQIVSSGSLILRNTKPVVRFDVTNDALSFSGSSMPSVSAASFIAVAQCNDSVATKFILTAGPAVSSATAGITFNNAERPAVFVWGGAEPTGNITTSQTLVFGTVSGTALSLWQNGTSVNTATNATSLALVNSTISVGCNPDVSLLPLNGDLQEAVVYYTSQATNRTAIESNINAHYAIY